MAATNKRRGGISERRDRPGAWLVRWDLPAAPDGKRRQASVQVKGDREDAERELTKQLAALDAGAAPEPSKQTLRQYLDTWLEETVKPRARGRTHEDYRYRLARYLPARIGSKRLQDVKSSELRALYRHMQTDKSEGGQGLSFRSVQYLHAILRAAFYDAMEGDTPLLMRNPACGALPPKQERKEQEQNRREITAMDKKQARAFVSAAGATPLVALWRVLLMAGLRPCEAFALRWSDFDGSRVWVQRSLVRPKSEEGGAFAFTKPKTRFSKRRLTLDPDTARALAELRRAQAAAKLAAGPRFRKDLDLIFCDHATGKPLHLKSTSVQFRKVLTAAELPAFRLYDLRHSYASLQAEAGTPIEVVSKRMGHSSIKLTADTYGHLFESQDAAATDRLAAFIAGDAQDAA